MVKKGATNNFVQRTLSVMISIALILILMPKKVHGINDYDLDSEGNLSIYTLEGLLFFGNEVNSGNSFSGKTVTLLNNIKLSSNRWNPIGNSSKPFSGTFDGGGHSITDLFLDGSISYNGLFGYISGGTVKDLTLENVHCTEGTGKNIGGVCGDISSYSHSSITNCVVNGIVNGGNDVGGIAGYMGKGNISNCVFMGSINAKNYVGGILGSGGGDTRVSECASFADVSGVLVVGGISGACPSNINCYATGNIYGESEVGGIVGGISWGSAPNDAKSCYFCGALRGIGHLYNSMLCYAGGIIGYDALGVCEGCVCLSSKIQGTNNKDFNILSFISAVYMKDKPGNYVYPYITIETDNDSNCYRRSDLVIEQPNGYNGEIFEMELGWQTIFVDSNRLGWHYAEDLGKDIGFNPEIWDLPVSDVKSPNYSIAALPTLKNVRVAQHPHLPYLNDFYYLCKTEDINLVPNEIPRFDLGDGYYRLWMNEGYYDYKEGTTLKTFTSTDPSRPFDGWVAKDDPSGAVMMNFAPAEDYSVREIVAKFGPEPARVFEAPVGDGTIVRVEDPYGQISPTWRLVVEPINDSLESHGVDQSLLAETEHGKLFLIYFKNENDEKVGEVKLDKAVKVMVPVPEHYDREDLKIFYVEADKEDVEHKLIGTETLDNHDYAVFESNHFSPYALIDILNEQEKAELAQGKNPATNDEFYSLTLILTSGILAGTVLTMILKFARVRKNKSK